MNTDDSNCTFLNNFDLNTGETSTDNPVNI